LWGVKYGDHGEYAFSSQFNGHKIKSLGKHEGWGSKKQLLQLVPSAFVTRLHFADKNGPTHTHTPIRISILKSLIQKC
jgi:hypothetical protein